MELAPHATPTIINHEKPPHNPGHGHSAPASQSIKADCNLANACAAVGRPQ